MSARGVFIRDRSLTPGAPLVIMDKDEGAAANFLFDNPDFGRDD